MALTPLAPRPNPRFRVGFHLGIDTLRRIQRHSKALPIIVMTGMEDEGLAIQAIGEGAQDYLFMCQFVGNLLVRSLVYAVERHRLALALEAQGQKKADRVAVEAAIHSYQSFVDRDMGPRAEGTRHGAGSINGFAEPVFQEAT